MSKQEIESFYPAGRQAWRAWLQENHLKKQAVWVLFYKTAAGVPTLSWSDAVDEALCFGWIDSTKRSLDDEKFIQYFSKRKPNSIWSRINKEKVVKLRKAGLMWPAGEACITTAQQNGSWTTLDIVEDGTIPEDLVEELRIRPGADDFFQSLSKSARKSILQWLVMAKRPETRRKRVVEIAELAGQQLKPKQFR